MKRALAISLLLLLSCRDPQETPKEDATVYQNEIEKWRSGRVTRLTGPDGWLSLVGLFWLNEGANRFGSDRAVNDIVMPANAPASAGTLTVAKDVITLTPIAPMSIAGKPVTEPVVLVPDTAPNGPTIVELGTMRFQIIARGGKYAIRVKDPESKERKAFTGIESFPIDPKWRVEARFEPYDPPKRIPITNIIGQTEEMVSPGALVFEVDGKEMRIDPVLEQGSDDYFLIFRDETSRDVSYPAGRYLYAAPPRDGKTIVDFNKAYNPPCAFTNFATCPLPPPQNRLPVRIEAGEKKYGHH